MLELAWKQISCHTLAGQRAWVAANRGNSKVLYARTAHRAGTGWEESATFGRMPFPWWSGIGKLWPWITVNSEIWWRWGFKSCSANGVKVSRGYATIFLSYATASSQDWHVFKHSCETEGSSPNITDSTLTIDLANSVLLPSIAIMAKSFLYKTQFSQSG